MAKIITGKERLCSDESKKALINLVKKNDCTVVVKELKDYN